MTEIDAIICLQVRGFEEKPITKDENGNDRSYWTKEEYEAATEIETL